MESVNQQEDLCIEGNNHYLNGGRGFRLLVYTISTFLLDLGANHFLIWCGGLDSKKKMSPVWRTMQQKGYNKIYALNGTTIILTVGGGFVS
jgi:hypothetical protein